MKKRQAKHDRAQQTLAEQLARVDHLAYPVIADPAYLAKDGYHPSEKGYAYIADQVATKLEIIPNTAPVTRARPPQYGDAPGPPPAPRA